MSTDVRYLEPRTLWNYFADLNEIPRPSKKEERICAFIKHFGENLSLETVQDEIGNIIIKKPASPGMENRKTVLLQSHLDMVHFKKADTDFDFSTQGIQMYVDGDWVKAKSTTLGADNGIGVASIMTILASKILQHPAIEALFTVDEETGMTGALGLKEGLFSAEIMLNLDTEDDCELTTGCAGAIDITASGNYSQETDLNSNLASYELSVTGLTGGHSGLDIHLGRGNANKIMNRLLFQAFGEFSLNIRSIDGGNLRNVIPGESFAVVSFPQENESAFKTFIETEKAILQQEYKTTDPSLQIQIKQIDTPAQLAKPSFLAKILRAIYACPNGIYRMSPDIADLVQTSNNLARVMMKDGEFTIQCLIRSAVDSEKMDLARAITSTFELADATITFGSSYPGWAPKPDSSILKLMGDLYREMYKDEPHVRACHAGLECGIIGQNYPNMEMISFGPTILYAHTIQEQVQISSVQKYWNYLLETLKRIPAKG